MPKIKKTVVTEFIKEDVSKVYDAIKNSNKYIWKTDVKDVKMISAKKWTEFTDDDECEYHIDNEMKNIKIDLSFKSNEYEGNASFSFIDEGCGTRVVYITYMYYYHPLKRLMSKITNELKNKQYEDIRGLKNLLENK